MKSFWALKGLKILVLMAFFIVLIGSVVMGLWNWLMPALFNLPLISFGQALGLTALSRILTGNYLFGWSSAGSKEHWQQKRQMWDKWSNMSAEERTKWKEEWRNRCRHRRPSDSRVDENIPADQI